MRRPTSAAKAVRSLATRRPGLVALAAALILLLWPAATAGAATFNVNKTADTADGSCDPADCSLREAIVAANASGGADTVNVPAGHYTLTLGTELPISATLTIVGAGAGATSIDGNATTRVFNVSGAGTAVTMSGLTIERGRSTNGSAILFGGTGTNTLTLRDSVFSNNSATGTGGVIGASYGTFGNTLTMTIANSTFSSNTAGLSGGGSGAGGAIFFDFGGGPNTLNLNVANSAFTGNRAGGGSPATSGTGGAIQIGSGGSSNSLSLSVTDTTLSGNRAGGDGAIGAGGGVFVDVGGAGNTVGLTVNGSTFSSNSAGGSGGGGTGGAIHFGAGVTSTLTLSAANSTISGNTAGGGAGTGSGGGIFFTGGIAGSSGRLTNVTVAGNTASGGIGTGGGLNAGANTTLVNTIIAGNTAAAGTNCFGPPTSGGHNLESADTCGLTAAGDLKNTDPQLDPLANNGGPTQTQALRKGSPAIDAGDNNGCPATDQRGGSRPQPPGGTCDIGAFEFGALADLAIAKTVSPDPVSAGKNLTYTLTVTNNGPDEAAGIRVEEAIPADTTLGSVSASQGSCSGTGPVACSIGTLTKGATATATIVVKPAKAGTTTNTATVSGNPTDTNPANNTATASATVRPTITSLKIKPRRFRAARRGGSIAARTGARVTYSVSEKASVRFTVERALRGRKIGKSCKAPTHKNRKRKRCTRYKRAKGSFKRTGKAGKKNRFMFTGRLARKRLRPGNYRLVGVATATGIESEQKTASFGILR